MTGGDETDSRVPVTRGDGKRRQRHHDARGDEMDREEAPPGEPLRGCVVDVDERRFVVDEVRVEQPAAHQLPGPDDVAGLVEIV